jgi:hypothetical protein
MSHVAKMLDELLLSLREAMGARWMNSLNDRDGDDMINLNLNVRLGQTDITINPPAVPGI